MSKPAACDRQYAYICFIALCLLMFAWVGLTVIFDKEYPITEDAMRVGFVERIFKKPHDILQKV